MYQKTTNTVARAYAIRATLTAAAAAVSLAWQTAPSSAREHHRAHHHHHHHPARQIGQTADAQAADAKTSSGKTSSSKTSNAQASMDRGAGVGGRTFSGMASYYGNESGSRTASGQRMAWLVCLFLRTRRST